MSTLRALALALLLLTVAACDPDYQGGTDQETWTAPDAVPFWSDGGAAIRVTCFPSHDNFSDPIVFPGQPLASHRHQFFGAVGVDWGTTNPRDHTHSTCEGGAFNRTGYWVPFMHDGDEPIYPAPYENAIQVYYKAGYRGVAEEMIEPFPEGLRMIAGNSQATDAQPGNVVWWTCEGSRHLTQGSGSPTIPACPPGSYLVANVEFPQCWDGVNLDSPDHKSHMAYGIGWRPNPDPPVSGCPSSHPVPLPQITEHVLYEVPEGSDTTTWRLASDMGQPGGLTLHADWWNGWDPQIMADIVNLCLRPSLDCRQGLIPYPDGLRKLGTAVP